MQQQPLAVPGFNEISLIEIVRLLWHNKILIASTTAIFIILSVIVALTSPEAYQSSARLVTKVNGKGNGGLAQLAALAGVSIGASNGEINISEYLPEVIKNYEFTQKLVNRKWFYKGDSLYLHQILEIMPDTSIKDWEKVFEKKKCDVLREGNYISLSKDITSGILTLTTLFPTSQLAYDVNNYCLVLLDKYILNSMKSQAKDKKLFIEQRLREVKGDLSTCENILVTFKERNVNLSSPKAFIEEQRLLRQIEFNQQVYIELQKQYEMARIQELNDQPLIEILRQPELSISRTKPARTTIVILGTFVGMLCSFILVIVGHWININFTGIKFWKV
jgi:capsule polysaccharide export protein KpsE/RkpR